jgi:hypothetical protein
MPPHVFDVADSYRIPFNVCLQLDQSVLRRILFYQLLDQYCKVSNEEC